MDDADDTTDMVENIGKKGHSRAKSALSHSPDKPMGDRQPLYYDIEDSARVPREKLERLRELLTKTSFFTGMQNHLQDKFQRVFTEEQIDELLKIDPKLGYEKEKVDMIYLALNLSTPEDKMSIFDHFKVGHVKG